MHSTGFALLRPVHQRLKLIVWRIPPVASSNGAAAAKSARRAKEHFRQSAGGATPQRVSGSVLAGFSCRCSSVPTTVSTLRLRSGQGRLACRLSSYGDFRTPAGETDRWAGAVEPPRRAGVVQPGLFVGREGVAVSPWVGQGCCGQVTAQFAAVFVGHAAQCAQHSF
jgi:hypothetical protein